MVPLVFQRRDKIGGEIGAGYVGNVFDAQRDVVEIQPGRAGVGQVFEVEGAIGELHVVDGAGPEIRAVEEQGDGIGDGTQQRRDAARRVRGGFRRLGRLRPRRTIRGIIPLAQQKEFAAVGGHENRFPPAGPRRRRSRRSRQNGPARPCWFAARFGRV